MQPSPSVLVILDMISTWNFPDAEKLLPGAQAVAPAIARLKTRCRDAGCAVIYANDNHGRWRSDFRQLLEAASARGSSGAELTQLIAPDALDYLILKPMHSAFFCTPLELLLQRLKARRLIITGVSSDQCVLITVGEARMREYECVVPRDAVASQDRQREARAIEHFNSVMDVDTPLEQEIRLHCEESRE
jgi:nicotinamidase-related amidase